MVNLGEQGCLEIVPLVGNLGDIQGIDGTIGKCLVVNKGHSIASCCRISRCGNRTAEVSDAVSYRGGSG